MQNHILNILRSETDTIYQKKNSQLKWLLINTHQRLLNITNREKLPKQKKDVKNQKPQPNADK